MTVRQREDGHNATPDIDRLLSEAPAWLMATAFEVEAGRLSLDQARARLEQRGLRIVDRVPEPVGSSEVDGPTITPVSEPMSSSDWLDPITAWRALRPEVREQIGAAAVATAIANLGANIATELADPIAHRHFHVSESEALSLIFELVNISVLGGDDTTLPPRPDLRPLGIHQCRVCGCTDDYACDRGCEWVEAYLCSACLPGSAR